jgi:hypothetical protein
VDSPSRDVVSPCLGFWFLNPSACQVCLHFIVYHVTSSMPYILVEEPYMFYPHVFSCYLEKLLQIFMGMTEKALRVAAFLSWLFQTSLPKVRFALTLRARTRCYLFSP